MLKHYDNLSEKNFIPVGFVALIPSLQEEEPFFPIAQTCPHGPHDMLIKG